MQIFLGHPVNTLFDDMAQNLSPIYSRHLKMCFIHSSLQNDESQVTSSDLFQAAPDTTDVISKVAIASITGFRDASVLAW